ncbi:MAG TPA: DUF1275 domain-containing protein [Erythrobacter sp.]|nr:DUF1275 domain-containing protein [Erythrobacter sp.]
MHRYDPARRKLALGLAFLAGTVDATGFIRTGGYFASFMSGNTTRLGLHIAGQPSIAYIPFALICGFVTGVVLGSLLASRWPDWRKRVLLAAVTLVLGAGAIASMLGSTVGFLAASALAMGMANNVFTKDGEVTVGVTYMTGALVRFGQGLAARMSGRSREGSRGYGWLWMALALGAIAGGMLHKLAQDHSPAILCAMAFLLFCYAALVEKGRTDDPPADEGI